MKKYIIFFIPLLIYGCYFKLSKKLKDKNPTEFLFNYPIDSTRKIATQIFSGGKYKDMVFRIGYFGFEKNNTKITDNENRNTFFLESNYWSPVGKSEIYYNWWGKLKNFPSYQIIFDSISNNQTMIKIISEPRVKTGVSIEFNHGFPYRFGAYTVKAKPSTVEEYEILLQIGKALGEKDMPPLKKPKIF